MDIKESIRVRINRIAETHFLLRPVLVSALKNQVITGAGKPYSSGAKNYYEFWSGTLSDKFYDMGVFIRLGAEIEICLRDYYMNKKGHSNLLQLNSDPKYKQGIFQRILPWQNKATDAVDLFKTEIGYDLNTNVLLSKIQELMVLRHLYAHNTGLINNKFITDYKKITGIDVLSIPEIKSHYPAEDCYYFAPLGNLSDFIESTRSFFRSFP